MKSRVGIILTVIVFLLLGLYYFGLFNLYDYKSWLRIIIITVFIVLINFIYNRIKNPGKTEKVDFDEIKDLFKNTSLKSGVNLPVVKFKKKRVNKTENECRKILEKIFKVQFPSCRPNFLKNPKTKKNLELDCYNKDLQIALEYNGQQHYFHVPTFQKSKKDFYANVFRDDWKRQKCSDMGITLIEVPYWAQHNLEEFIRAALRKKGVL